MFWFYLIVLKDGKLKRFIEALSVCHTVQIDETGEDKYNASSPDELSFINFLEKYKIFASEFDLY